MLILIFILLLIITALMAAKYIPYIIILAVLYYIFGNATLGVIIIFGFFYLRHKLNKDDNKKQ